MPLHSVKCLVFLQKKQTAQSIHIATKATIRMVDMDNIPQIEDSRPGDLTERSVGRDVVQETTIDQMEPHHGRTDQLPPLRHHNLVVYCF
jgi:hypothetical protein